MKLNIYVDTSLLVSLYSLDGNSAKAAQAMSTKNAGFYLSTLCELELFNALELRVFRKEITAAQARSSRNDFEGDLRDGIFRLSPLADTAFARARQLSLQTTARLGTRTADLLHIAAALEFGAGSFYSFDRQQRKLAQTVGLKINPD
ncbi:MAG: type II toxin-antitoxin system VapC family toxin [Acidobacteria bacterium]|nr:type II toxin-antitoxin system VapC family toxin [Acidobacteriota bacterium]